MPLPVARSGPALLVARSRRRRPALVLPCLDLPLEDEPSVAKRRRDHFGRSTLELLLVLFPLPSSHV